MIQKQQTDHISALHLQKEKDDPPDGADSRLFSDHHGPQSPRKCSYKQLMILFQMKRQTCYFQNNFLKILILFNWNYFKSNRILARVFFKKLN